MLAKRCCPPTMTVAWFVALIGVTGIAGIAQTLDTFRTWTDKTGKFKTEAQLIEVGDDAVKLRKRDGAEIKVAIAKLSPADLEHLRKREAAKPVHKATALFNRTTETEFSLKTNDKNLAAFMGFCFFAKEPNAEQVDPAENYLKDRLTKLATIKTKLPGSKDDWTGFDVMRLAASNSSQNMSVNISPFRGAGNKSGTYGYTGEFFDVGGQRVLFLFVFCLELSKKRSPQHSLDFSGLGIGDDEMSALRSARQAIMITCNESKRGGVEFGPTAKLGPKAGSEPALGPESPTESKSVRPGEETAASVKILILRETGFAGAPVKDAKNWYEAELAKLADVDRSESLRKTVRDVIPTTDAPFVDNAKSIAQLFSGEPKLEYLVLVYVNSASLRCQVNGLTDNMMVGRKDGSFELIMHPKHKDFGHSAPPRATNIFYANYSGAVAAVFRRGEKTPLAYEFALDQNQSLNLPKDPDFPALIKTVLAKPAVTRALPAGK